MSQRKKTYTIPELVTELRAMDRQMIHGSDIFAQCADALEKKSRTADEVQRPQEATCKCGKEIYLINGAWLHQHNGTKWCYPLPDETVAEPVIKGT